jgi:hypothetical protein
MAAFAVPASPDRIKPADSTKRRHEIRDSVEAPAVHPFVLSDLFAFLKWAFRSRIFNAPPQ